MNKTAVFLLLNKRSLFVECNSDHGHPNSDRHSLALRSQTEDNLCKQNHTVVYLFDSLLTIVTLYPKYVVAFTTTFGDVIVASGVVIMLKAADKGRKNNANITKHMLALVILKLEYSVLVHYTFIPKLLEYGQTKTISKKDVL